MAPSDFNFKNHHDGIHHCQINRPITPSPYSFPDNQDLHTDVPYIEMEPLDQMIYDLEVERRSQLAAALEEDNEEEYFRSYNPDTDLDPLDKAILDLEADQESHLAMNKTEEDIKIHHYNWFGTAIYHTSSTPPEQSLAIIMSKPKATSSDSNLRINTVLNQAYLYLDPVIIHFDVPNGSILINQLLQRDNLNETMKGHVVKYYTPHGLWMSESLATNDRIEVDDGIFANYIVNYAAGNGFISQSYITSWKQWKSNYNKVRATERKTTRARRNRMAGPRLSPLRQVMTAEAEDRAEVEDAPSLHSDNSSMIVNRYSWPTNTAHRHWVIRNDRLTRGDIDWLEAADPNSYYSLPFPEPMRRGHGVGGTLRRASKSALSYLMCGIR
ncbi:unnamed protein product [Penicillium manginii]